MIVKVCGITSLEDARQAVGCGANALGFNFYPPSLRYLHPEQAAAIIEGIEGADVLTVAVVVGGSVGGQVSGTVAIPESIAAVQVHGIEHAADLPDYGRRIFVAVSKHDACRFPDNEIIIDSSWGTGRVDDWTALSTLGRPYILSGGLNPDNVGRAIETLHPAGVDVCSGVESAPGRKDMQKLKRFIAEVRRVYGEF